MRQLMQSEDVFIDWKHLIHEKEVISSVDKNTDLHHVPSFSAKTCDIVSDQPCKCYLLTSRSICGDILRTLLKILSSRGDKVNLFVYTNFQLLLLFISGQVFKD